MFFGENLPLPDQRAPCFSPPHPMMWLLRESKMEFIRLFEFLPIPDQSAEFGSTLTLAIIV